MVAGPSTMPNRTFFIVEGGELRLPKEGEIPAPWERKP